MLILISIPGLPRSGKKGLPRPGKIIWKIIFFPGQGNLERTWKIREKSGNLKVNGYGRQLSEKIFIQFKRGKDEIVQTHLPLHWGLLSKERIWGE